MLAAACNTLKFLIRKVIRHAKAGDKILINCKPKTGFFYQSSDLIDTLCSTQSLLKRRIRPERLRKGSELITRKTVSHTVAKQR